MRIVLCVLMNGCREFHNFYNRKHNRIADKIADESKLHLPRYRVYSNKLAESLFPELQDSLSVLLHRKPDIVVMDRISRICFIAEIKVCFDLYFEYDYLEKIEREQTILGTNTDKIILFLDRNDIEKSQEVVLLGIAIENKLTFKTYIERI